MDSRQKAGIIDVDEPAAECLSPMLGGAVESVGG